jgi:hypothetical protein
VLHPVTGSGTRAKTSGNWQASSSSGKATEPAQNPLIQITIEVCDHATMLASGQHVKLVSKTMYILYVQGWHARGCPRACEQWADLHLGQDVQMVRSPFSRWYATLNRAIPPDFLVKSTHVYGDSVRNCSGSG